MEIIPDYRIAAMDRPKLQRMIGKLWDREQDLDMQRRIEVLRLDAIEKKLREHEDPMGDDFEYWSYVYGRQRARISELARECESYQRQRDNMERELYARSIRG